MANDEAPRPRRLSLGAAGKPQSAPAEPSDAESLQEPERSEFSGRLSCVSVGGIDVHLLELQHADLDMTRFLSFRDPRVEARYWSEHARLRIQVVQRMSYIYAFFGTCEFFLAGGLGRVASPAPSLFVSGLLRLANIAFMIALGAAIRWRRCTVEHIACAVCFVLPVTLAMSDPFSTTVMLDKEPLEITCGGGRCPTIMIMLFIIIGTIPFLLQARLKKVVLYVPWSMIVYAALKLNPAAAERDPSGVVGDVIVLLVYCGVSLMLTAGSSRNERDMRLRWGDNLVLRMEVERQRQALLEHAQWAKEAEALEKASADPGPVAKEVTEKEASAGTAPIVRLPKPDQASVAPTGREPNALLVSAMAGRSLDLERLERMCDQLREPSYGLQQFFDDATATFPELQLFLAAGDGLAASGRSAEVEYQRTVGALFAVFWLVRLNIDGKQGFCFGYDDTWQVNGWDSRMTRKKHRRQFMHDVEWSAFETVTNEALEGSKERLKAMLCLTAFHDIMKIQALCPTVAAEHAPYEGYQAGEVINDHDLALAYVLDKYPECLPSFRELPEASRSVIAFTQAKMQFNHGWFVQAEAPPGHMLSKFKAALARARPADLAFYFLHWLTDLSGAEGRPLAGAEKFVLCFPQAVLSAFLWSIPFLEHLAEPGETETSVVERYLEARFRAAAPEEPLPRSPEAVALMRLVVMAQRSARWVLEAFPKLPGLARQTLTIELARTGLRDQHFRACAVDSGPALFVYYGPALLQYCTSEAEMRQAMITMAAIYRAGRCLWPADQPADGWCVTLEAGALKPVAAEVVGASLTGGMLVLQRRSRSEGVVAVVTGRGINGLLSLAADARALELEEADWQCPDTMSEDGQFPAELREI